MRILDWICEKELHIYEARLEKLKDIEAPGVIIDGLKAACEALKNKDIKINGDVSLLDNTIDKYEVKKGRGGKAYVEFNGNICYFPEARYGRFITRKED